MNEETMPHTWFTAADLAAQLSARQHGDHWRAACPAHGGENPQALKIKEGTDSQGNPMTLLHCYAHQCPIEAICAALGIQVVNLFCIHPTYAKATRHAPRAKSPRLDKLKSIPEPSRDDIAQILLEEMIVSDPEWIQTCAPARAELWALAQQSLATKSAFFVALKTAGIAVNPFWRALAAEQDTDE
jgi:hypothetical protein